MSNRKPDINLSQLSPAINFAFEQKMKNIWTALPGIVISYTPATRRARVRPGVRLVKTDGAEIQRAPIPDVPVVFPGGGGMIATFPMQEGDKVLLVFSARGIAEFKRIWDEATPCPDSLFSERDAFAIPMGRNRSITPANESAASLQTEDGSTSITLQQGEIHIRANRIYLHADRIDDVAYDAP